MKTVNGTTVQGSEAATSHGSETGTNPLSVLSDLAMSEVQEDGAQAEQDQGGAAAAGATDEGAGTTGSESESAGDTAGDTGADGARVTFTAEQQKVFDARLGKEVAKRKTEQEKAEALTTKVSTLESELASVRLAAEDHVPLHPEWAEKADLEAIVQTNRLEAEAQRLKANWQGIESEDPAKAMTAEQVQQQYAQVTADLAALKPKANAAWKTAQRQFVDDAKLGRQIRLERAKAAARAGQGAAADGGKTTATVTPAGQGTAGRAATETPLKRGQSRDRFDKAGGTREAAEKELAELVAM